MKLQVILGFMLTVMMVHARPVRPIYLDKDIPNANVVAVVKVVNIETTAAGVQFGQFRVDELNVSCSVIHSIKGDCTVGSTLNFLHRKAAPSPEQTMIINGFTSFRFQPGHNYLLVLTNDQDGRLQLPAPEAFSIPEFSDAMSERFSAPVKNSTELANTVALLFLSLMSEDERPEYSLKNLTFLNQIRQFREMLREESQIKPRIIERLVQIKENVSDWNNLAVIHQNLTYFGDYRYLDEAVAYVLDETNGSTDRCNAVSSWFQNYPEDQQVKAYRTIISDCEDESVCEAAQQRLSYLWDLPSEVQTQLQQLLDPSNETFSIEDFTKFLSECYTASQRGSASAVEAPAEPEKWQNLHQKIIMHLKTALESEQTEVRRRAALVLHHFNDNSGVTVLMTDYATGDAVHRGRVIEALRTLKDKQAIPVLITVADDPLPHLRSIAISALGELGAMEAFDAIVKHLDDKEQTEGILTQMLPAQSACYALGQLRTPQSIRPLIKALDDTDLQDHAIKALNEIRKNGFSYYVTDSSIKVSSPDVFLNRDGLGSYSLQFPEDPGDDPVKWKRWGAWYLLNDETINARIYPDWRQDPTGYTMTKLAIKNHVVQFDSLKDQKEAVVVILPEEQDCPLLQTLFQRQIFASLASQANHLQVPYYDNLNRPDIQEKLNKGTLWFFNDALGAGNLIKDAVVQVYLYKWEGPRIWIGEYKTDGSITRYAMTGNISDTEFIVSHPDYGRAKAQVYGDFDKFHLGLPLVPKDSPAASRAVWGYIVDPDNQPVTDVEVYCENVRTLGEGLINGDYNFCRARGLTDEKGFFRYYMPPMRKDGPAEFGELIPPKSRYSLRVEVPDDRLLFPFNGQTPNGEETTIMLQRKAITDLYEDVEQVQDSHFHTFRFYSQQGELTTKEELNRLSAEIHRPDEPKIKLSAAHFKDSAKIPNGIIKASFWTSHPGDAVDFEPLEVTDESPEELVFTVPLLTYKGRVLHAHTNEPMEGVFVIAKQGNRKGNLSMITDEEWQGLHALPTQPSPEEASFKTVREIYGFYNVVRTDSDGRFEMHCPQGDTPYGFIFFEQNYIGLMHRRHQLKPDENGIVEIPTQKMYPAAKVIFKANSDKKHISIGPKWIIDKNGNPDWVKEFLKNDDQQERHFTYDHWIEQNQVQSVYVPADVTLKLQLRTPYDEDYDDYTFPQEIALSQGQVLDLGDCDFSKNICIYVKVVDSQGNPVEGAPVRKKIRNSYYLPSISDKNGLSEFMVPPGSSGEFAVTYWGEEGGPHKHLVESVSFQTQSRQDEGATFTLAISDEMIESLFTD